MKKFVFLCTALTVAACGGAKMPSNLNDEKVFFAFDSAEITPEMAKRPAGPVAVHEKASGYKRNTGGPL